MDFAHYFFQNTTGTTSIGNSLRFRGAQYLERSFATAGNRRTWTWSGWLKASSSTGQRTFWAQGTGTGSSGYGLSRFANENIQMTSSPDGASASATITSNNVFRDPSAWYHIVIALDTTEAVNSDRYKLYVNGALVPRTAATNPSPDAELEYNRAAAHQMGVSRAGATNHEFQGYMAEVHFVDGQALDPTTFGGTNDNGVWVPRGVSIDDYGTNGFYLDMDPDNTDTNGPAGATRLLDQSPNDNHWVMNGFELANTASTNYDWMADSPTQNYATLNPLDFQDVNYKPTLSEGNLKSENLSARTYGTIGIPATGKFYFEGQAITVGTSTANFGVSTGSWGSNGTTFPVVPGDTLPTYTNELLGCAVNVDDGEVTYYKNNVNVGTVNPSSLEGAFVYLNNGGNWVWSVNFGQRPFAHTPPAGFEPLQTQELPAVDITNPSDHFDVITDTGANILTAAQAKFSNGLWWIKDRANSNDHQFVDSVRGNTRALTCPSIQNEVDYRAPSGNSVAWCWEASDDFTSNAGTNPSTGKRNLTSGFSMFTADTPSGSTVGHGLNQAPDFIIYRPVNSAGAGWRAWHKDIGLGNALYLNTNDQATADSIAPTAVGATTYTIGTGTIPETLHVHYCWHSVPGYSAFGTYTGNGSGSETNFDGPFVYTGFKPAFVLIKKYNFSAHWIIFDSTRNPYNSDISEKLYPSLNVSSNNAPSDSGTRNTIDFLSNGFKLTSGFGYTNATTSANFIYAAFAEHPFGGSNISPTTAR